VLAGLAAMSAAATPAEVAAAAVRAARAVTAARAAALAWAGADDDMAVIVASEGYDCDTMSPGVTVPLESGLPLTEAIRTRRPVIRPVPRGGGWLAFPVPLGDRSGSLLVSLSAGEYSEASADDCAVLASLAAAALARAMRETPVGAPGGRTGREVLRIPWLDTAVVERPGSGRDAAVVWPDGDAGAWLAVADVAGSDPAAGEVATALRAVLPGILAASGGPADALDRLASWLYGAPVAGERFLTAAVVHIRRGPSGGQVRLASAGHPSPLLVGADGRVLTPADPPGVPLHLGVAEPVGSIPRWAEHTVAVGGGDLLFAYSDGRSDRATPPARDRALESLVRSAATEPTAAGAADHVLHSLDRAGADRDDLTLIAIRLAER